MNSTDARLEGLRTIHTTWCERYARALRETRVAEALQLADALDASSNLAEGATDPESLEREMCRLSRLADSLVPTIIAALKSTQ